MNMATTSYLHLIAVGAAFTLSGCSEESRQVKRDFLEKRRQEQSRVLTQLAAEHGASCDWPRAIGLDGYGGLESLSWRSPPVYAIDLQRALVSEKPIGFLGTLGDVSKDGELYRLTFLQPGGFAPFIIFSLQADVSQVESILSNRPGRWDVFAVVAKVHGVRRSAMELNAYPEGYEDATIEAEFVELPFHATGKCIAFKSIVYEIE